MDPTEKSLASGLIRWRLLSQAPNCHRNCSERIAISKPAYPAMMVRKPVTYTRDGSIG